uniref:Uncharacterized protein n=1 Tax=Arundo donax TaxID=35708 RepID=A0A0A9G9G8_ARUDO
MKGGSHNYHANNISRHAFMGERWRFSQGFTSLCIPHTAP